MPAPRNRRHILVPGAPESEPFTAHLRNMQSRPFPRPEDRPAHAAKLIGELGDVTREVLAERARLGVEVEAGLYVEFVAPAGVDLDLARLASRLGRGVIGDAGWEVAHFDYRLADKGQEAVRFLEAKYPTESALVRSAIRQVLSASSLDYIELSVAAKAAWILESQGKTVTSIAIADAAGRLGWQVHGTQVERAAEFLKKLDRREPLSA